MAKVAKIVLAVLLFCTGALLGRGFAPEPTYRTVEVPVERIVEVERIDTVVTTVEKIVYVHKPAKQIATAPEAGQPDVASFCADAVALAIASVQQDSVPQPTAQQLLLRSVRHRDAWFLGRDELVITGPLSDGGLRQITYAVRGGFEVRTHADTAIVRYPRTSLVKGLLEILAPAAIGFAAGKVF